MKAPSRRGLAQWWPAVLVGSLLLGATMLLVHGVRYDTEKRRHAHSQCLNVAGRDYDGCVLKHRRDFHYQRWN